MDSAELCERYRALYMPVVCDTLYGLGLPEQVLPSSLRPLQPEQRMVGLAHTVLGKAIEPHIDWDAGIERIRSYLQVFEELASDSVLVSVNPASHVGHFGELTANAAQARGCVGCVLDGNLRDIEGLRDINFQVFYRDLSPLNAIGRWEMTEAQQAVTIGDVVIHPGDVIIGEFDGILVVPKEQAEQVLVRAEEIVASEEQVRREVAAGGTPMESFDKHGHI
jgi:4-hydroxy-4-methyl-2-oxoglutarate aldolase